MVCVRYLLRKGGQFRFVDVKHFDVVVYAPKSGSIPFRRVAPARRGHRELCCNSFGIACLYHRHDVADHVCP